MKTTILTVAEIDPLLERVRAAAGRTTQAIGRLIALSRMALRCFGR